MPNRPPWKEMVGARGGEAEAEAGRLREFKDSLVYIMSTRTARDIQRDPVSKSKKEGDTGSGQGTARQGE